MNKILTDYQQAHNEFNRHIGNLQSEVQRIVDILKKKFKVNQIWWDWEYSEGIAPPPMILEEDEIFEIYISTNPHRTLDDGFCSYSEGFPIEFFDMTEAEIITYINKNIADTRRKNVEKAERMKQKIATKQQLKEEVLAKLSAEERKILGLK